MFCLRFLLLLVLLVLGTQISYAQHWSHGWYPGGKRALDEITGLEVSEEGKVWDSGEMSLLKTLLAEVLSQQQRKK
ncbi:progonadoliberin-2 isoform X2 [Notamacropus eugenii]